MPDDEQMPRRLRRLAVEHAETRWLALRLDDDIQVVHEDLQQVRDELRTVEDQLTEHGGRFDSIDAQLRSLTTMVGEVLHRLPGSSDDNQ